MIDSELIAKEIELGIALRMDFADAASKGHSGPVPGELPRVSGCPCLCKTAEEHWAKYVERVRRQEAAAERRKAKQREEHRS